MVTEIKLSLSDWLKNERNSRGLTTRQLGATMGVSHSRITQIEKGGPATPDMVERLARALSSGDDHIFRALLNAGLKAGFPRPEDAGNDANPDNPHIIYNEDYKKLPPHLKRMIDGHLQAAADDMARRLIDGIQPEN